MPYVQQTPEQIAASNIAHALGHLAQAQQLIANVTASVMSGESAMCFSTDPEENQATIDLCTQAVLDLQDLRGRLST